MDKSKSVRCVNRMQASTLFCVALLGWLCQTAFGDNLAPDVNKIGEAFAYPSSLMVINDVTLEERKLHGDAILSAIRVESSVPKAFYPLLITVAKQGTYLQPRTQEILDKYDAYRASNKEDDVKTPWGRFMLGSDIKGGIYMGEVKAPANGFSLNGYFTDFAAISEATIEGAGIDMQICILQPFGADELVRISGGERYHEFWVPAPGRNRDGRLNIRTMLLAANSIVVESMGASGIFRGDASKSNKTGNNVNTLPAPQPAVPPIGAFERRSERGWVVLLIAIAGILGWVLWKKRGA